MRYRSLKRDDWEKRLEQLLLTHTIYAGIANENSQDYELIRSCDIPRIVYNKPKPVTPLKSFFLPVRENVTSYGTEKKQRIIIGAPNCDIEGLTLLDEIYLDKDFPDTFYRERRENTLLISSDCFGTLENCHCLTYDIKPFATVNADLAVISLDGVIILRVLSSKGDDFASGLAGAIETEDNLVLAAIEKEHKATESNLNASNKLLPGYRKTGDLVNGAKKEIWEKYSSTCVSCGACATICPTCTCFLLIDKPGFEKVKQLDACQYPGFERVAGGEDALFERANRFRNRYMCKYVWKPQKFNAVACTGCGRCIEACIGKINKNELFSELAG